MTAKEYLSQIRDIQDSISNNEATIRRLMSRATSISATDYSKDVVKTSGKPYAKFETIIDGIAEIQKKIVRDNVNLIELEDEIRDKVNGIQNRTYRTVLYKRYILMLDWQEIADEMNYTFRHVTRLHGEALQDFSKQYGFPKDVL